MLGPEWHRVARSGTDIMVKRNEAVQEKVFQVSDGNGRCIGRVVLPTGDEILGRHAGTVFLNRRTLPLRPNFPYLTPPAGETSG